MKPQPREYELAELIENPALGLAMEHQGIDRRSLALLLGRADSDSGHLRQRESGGKPAQ